MLIHKDLLRRHAGALSQQDAFRALAGVESNQKLAQRRYDIFLSHNFKDAVIVYGLALMLKAAGYHVFVDWLEAPGQDRDAVTPLTAEYLRKAMRNSDSLVYAVSTNAMDSRWMPWELGFSDGLHSRVAILPIEEYQTQADSYHGREYLGLYPYVTVEYLAAYPTYFVRQPGGITKVGLADWVKR